MRRFVSPTSALRRARRGFTLIEIVIVLAVVGVLGGLAAYGFGNMRSRRSVHDAAREVVAQIHRLRAVGAAGRLGETGPFATGGPLNADLDGATGAFRQTGIRVDNDQTLTFFGATGGAGATDIIAVIDLDAQYPDGDVRVAAPGPGAEVRFRRNATLVPATPNTLTLVNQDNGQQVQIRITLAGIPRIL